MSIDLSELLDTDSVHSNDEDIVQQCLSAFKRGDEEESFRLLGLLGDPTEVTDENGATFAHLAAKNGWAKVIEKGLDARPNSDKSVFKYLRRKDGNGKTALQYASANKHWNVMALLFMSGLAENQSGGGGDELNYSAAPRLFKECLPVAGPLSGIISTAMGFCEKCEELEEHMNRKNDQLELLAKQCLGRAKENERLLKRLRCLQVSDLPELMEATADIQTQWKELGHAMGISDSILNEISSNESNGELRYLYEMMRFWVINMGATWGGLIGAMRSYYVDQNKLADDLEMKISGHCETLQVHAITPNEKPLKESEIESLMNGVFGSEQAHVDWKVLGLMLGLSDSTLEKIQSSIPDDGFEKAMLRHWIELGRAYCSVLVHVLAGPVIDERGVARDNAKTFLDLDLFGSEVLEDGISVSEESIEAKRQEIFNACGKNPSAQGIVFLIGVGDVAGTDIDGENVSKTFRNLNFIIYRQENSSLVELSCLVKTVAFGKCFPLKCKYIAFYYAGHGGIDERGDAFMKVKDGSDGRFYVDRNMLNHFEKNKVNKKRRCLFFFDCCLSSHPKHESGKRYYPQVPLRCLAAYATSVGLKSLGDNYEGGVWTRKLCENLKETLSVSDILDHTHTDVGDTQPSVYLSSAGAVFLNGSPRYFTTDATDLSDPIKIWKSHQEELKNLLKSNKRILVLLSSGLHFEGIIDRDTKTNGMKQADGAEVIVEAVREKLVSSPELLHKVLDVMDKYDLLVGLVARMRKALGFLQDKPKNLLEEYHAEILEILLTDAGSATLTSLCGGLLSQDLIDWQTLQDATNRPHTDGPDVLLTYLEQRINGEPSLLGRILDVMEMEDPLREIVGRIRKKLIKKQLDSAARTSLAFSKPEQILDELQREREKRNWKRKLKLRLRLFLKPIGILKFILMFSTLLAFSLTASFNSGSNSNRASCQDAGYVVHMLTMKFSYPYNPNGYSFTYSPALLGNASGGCFETSVRQVFSISAEYFVTISCFSFIYAVLSFMFYFELYIRRYDLAKHYSIIDLVITCFLVVFYFFAVIVWSAGISQLNSNHKDLLKDKRSFCLGSVCPDENTYSSPTTQSISQLRFSVLFGWVSFLVLAGSIWFIYKDTMFHQDRIGPLYQLKICKRNNQQESPVNRAEAGRYKPEKDEEQKPLTCDDENEF